MSGALVDPADLADARRHLRADCGRCAGLCCVAPAFAASADFAIDKPAGRPCPNLRDDFGCGIHDSLRERGFPGCAVFDCLGAGQQVVQVTFEGQHWREGSANTMFSVFTVMRQLHELLWHLAEAVSLVSDGPLREQLAQAQQEISELTGAAAAVLADVDATALRQRVGPLLGRASEQAREGFPRGGHDRLGADLMGAALRSADLRGVSLRGAYLIGADLRGADLRWTDLLGADLRAADLRGARLDGSLFLTQPQLDAAKGDASTTLPSSLTRPGHWPAS